jgi:hypothetical protein
MKNSYLVLLVVFWLSLPLAYKRDSVALVLNGYDLGLAFELSDFDDDQEKIDDYYYAYKNSFGLIRAIVWSCLFVWLLTFAVSVRQLVTRSLVVPRYVMLSAAAVSGLLLLISILLLTVIRIPVGMVT